MRVGVGLKHGPLGVINLFVGCTDLAAPNLKQLSHVVSGTRYIEMNAVSFQPLIWLAAALPPSDDFCSDAAARNQHGTTS